MYDNTLEQTNLNRINLPDVLLINVAGHVTAGKTGYACLLRQMKMKIETKEILDPKYYLFTKQIITLTLCYMVIT